MKERTSSGRYRTYLHREEEEGVEEELGAQGSIGQASPTNPFPLVTVK